MAKYKVKNTSILHNGKVYAEGSTLELSENQAKRLQKLGNHFANFAKRNDQLYKP